ncbi:MAG: hydroxyacid dehydrogenase [Bacteroidales bacterium]|nr:hydroxyacid dehydrogenase [Bacteroidales bacterium]
MNINCIEPLGISLPQFEKLQKEFAQQGHQFSFCTDRREDEANLIARMKDADVVVVSNIRLSANVLSQCPHLQYLSVAFTGLDHIDLAYCQAHNITVQNAAGYSTIAVSELAIGLVIDLYRRISAFNNEIRQGGGRGAFLGTELHGKTVGIVGTGAIGMATIRLLKAFGCHVLAYSRSQRTEAAALGAEYTTLEQLLRQSDIISLHVPLNDSTYHLIGEAQLQQMKPTAILVNTARGNVMDIDAVSKALSEGRIAGVATDVYESEPPLPADHCLLHAPNCICLPHVGFATREAFDIRADIVFDHVRQWIGKQTTV